MVEIMGAPEIICLTVATAVSIIYIVGMILFRKWTKNDNKDDKENKDE